MTQEEVIGFINLTEAQKAASIFALIEAACRENSEEALATLKIMCAGEKVPFKIRDKILSYGIKRFKLTIPHDRGFKTGMLLIIEAIEENMEVNRQKLL